MWTDYALGKRLRPVTDRTRPCGPKEPGFPVGHVTKPMSPGAVTAPLPAECVCHTLSTMTPPTILISGAGVAGPALAHWLSANGYRVVVVEVAPAIRPGGQTVDLRGAGRGVVERMGLLDQMADRSTRQRGIAWVRSDGSRRAEMPVEAFDGNGVVSKLEILRGDLSTCCTGTPRTASSTASTRASPHSNRPTTPSTSRSPTARRSWRTCSGCGRTALGGASDGLRARGAVRQTTSHDPAIGKAGLAFRSEPLTYDRRRSRTATEAAGRQVRRRRLACRRIDQRGSASRRLLLRRLRPGAHGDVVGGPRDAVR